MSSMPSRAPSPSEEQLRKIYNWFPTFFSSLSHLIGGSFRMSPKEKEDWKDMLIEKADYMIKDLEELKTLIKNDK